MEESNKKEFGMELPKLTLTNFKSHFKDKFGELSLQFGDCSEIILQGVDVTMTEPKEDDKSDKTLSTANGGGFALKYDGANGYKRFEKDERKFQSLRDNKKKLIGRLLNAMENSVKVLVTTHKSFDNMIKTYDLHGIWNLTQEVCLGKGGVSAYSQVLTLLQMKQGEEYPTYEKDFKGAVDDLMTQGTAEEILKMILNVLFIMGLDQEQFKDKLTPIFGTTQWPDFKDLSAELHTYAEALRTVKTLTEKTEGKVSANAASANEAAGEQFLQGCWNCGSLLHKKFECKDPPATCSRCTRKGHLGPYCQSTAVNSNGIRKSTTNNGQAKTKDERPRGNNATNKAPARKAGFPKKTPRQKVLSKAIALMTEQLADLKNEIDDNDAANEDAAAYLQEYPEDYAEDVDNEEVDSNMARTSVEDEATDYNDNEIKDAIQLTTSLAAATDDLVFDTGCNGAHLLMEEHATILSDLVPSKTQVNGISGGLKSTVRGRLGKVGRGLVAKELTTNLISVMLMVKQLNGTFDGDKTTLRIRDASGKVVLTGHNHGDGFWKCKIHDLQASSCMLGAAEGPDSSESPSLLDSSDEDEPGSAVPLDDTIEEPLSTEELHSSIKTVPPLKHFTGEEMKRAQQARNLCAALCHPGSRALIQALDNGNYDSVHLTSQDVRNAVVIYGECTSCLEGKIRAAPTPKASVSPPAPTIGHTLHCDYLILTGTSIGGNKIMLFSIDEKGGFVSLMPLPNKSTLFTCAALDAIIAEYKAFGHTVVKIQFDHESNFLACKNHLQNKGIQFAATPAGHHEKMAERNIQTLKNRQNALIVGLAYELPSNLEAESYTAAVHGMNMTPRKRSGAFTPYQLMTKQRPKLPRFYFGETGVFHKRRQDNPKQRGEWGIFLGHDSSQGIRAFLPTRNGVYSMRKFVPHKDFPLKEWGYKPRIRKLDVIDKKPLTVPQPTASPLLNVSPIVTAPTTVVSTIITDVPTIASTTGPSPSVILQNQGGVVKDGHPVVVSTQPLVIQANHPQSQPVNLSNKKGVLRVDSSIGNSKTVKKTVITSPAAVVNTPAAPPSQPTVIVQPVPLPDPQPPPADATVVSTSTTSSRPKRAAAEQNWKDGPSKLRSSSAFVADLELCTALSAQVLNDPHGPLAVVAYRMSLRKALNDKTRKESTILAINEEIHNMENSKVGTPILYEDIPQEELQFIVPSHMFLKDKFKADGSYDKTKARLVVNGEQENPDHVGDTYAPTVNPISVFTQLNYTVCKGMELSAYDIKGAFLLTGVGSGRIIYIRIAPDVATHWIRLYPRMAKFLSKNGCLYLRLNKYLYGLQESPHEFNNLLNKKLTSMGFNASRADRCLYIKKTTQGRMIISTHVDDLLVTSPNVELRTWLETELQKSFEIVKQYDHLSYLGMNIHYDKARMKLSVSQVGAIQDIVTKFGYDNLRKFPATPAVTEQLLADHSDSPACDKSEFLSLVMSLMYIARLTRPDILMAVTALASRTAAPTDSDMNNLHRVLRYLAGTTTTGLEFDGTIPLRPVIYADASHHIHPEAVGHAGIIITLGSAPILSRSFKIKFVTRSSSESELYALEEASTYAGWLRLLLSELGVPSSSEPIKTFQDNKSTIVIASTGGNFKRLKHLLVREAFVQERVRCGDILLQYLATDSMPADLLTKPLSAPKLSTHLSTIHVCNVGSKLESV